jgi:hypothetical protein
MAKDKISDYSSTANSNTDIAGINIDEGCAPSGINDAIRTLMAQLKTWQSGGQDVYIHPAGSASAPSITANGDTNTGIFFPAADTVAVTTGGTERARVDSSGNMGLGVTPSGNFMLEAGSTTAAGRSFKLMTLTGGFSGGNYPFFGYNFRSTTTSGTYRYDGNDVASAINFASGIAFNIATSGTAGNAITWNTAMTLDASGNLGVGTTTPDVFSTAYERNASFVGSGTTAAINVSGATAARVQLGVGSTRYGYIYQDASNFLQIATTTALPIAFNTNSTERARITAAGVLLVGVTATGGGGSHLIQAGTGVNALQCQNNSSTLPYGPYFNFSAASPNNTTSYFLACDDTTNIKAMIYSNGTFGSRTSTYGGISDIKVKQDIVDASSQWGDIKALRFRKYRFKDDPTGPLQLGLISQEAELVSPGLVFESPDTINVEVPVLDENGDAVFNEDGTPQTTTERQETGEVTKSVKYSILYMKAVVALQEAMNRIEQLEADVAALKG